MPSITEPQWSAIRRTAGAVAREVSKEAAMKNNLSVTAMAAELRNLESNVITDLAALSSRLDRVEALAPPITYSFKLTEDKLDAGVDGFIHRSGLYDAPCPVAFGAGNFSTINVPAPAEPLNGMDVSSKLAPGAVSVRAVCGDDFLTLRQYDRHGDFLSEVTTMADTTASPLPSPEKSRSAKPKVTNQKPEYREGNKTPPCLPAGEFYIVSDARCHPFGGSPEHNLPWLISPGKVMHGSEAQALSEAARLAKEHGVPYVVLHGTHIVNPVMARTVGHTTINKL
jgi:hypothetical protein